MLACYLMSVREKPDLQKAFANGVVCWLEKEEPKYSLYPVPKSCTMEAIKYFPKLEAGLSKAQQTRPPSPSSDSEDEVDFMGGTPSPNFE